MDALLTLSEMDTRLREIHLAKARLRETCRVVERRLAQLDREDKELSVAIYLERHGHKLHLREDDFSDTNIAALVSEISNLPL